MDRRQHFAALENAASSLSAQERVAAIAEVIRIQDAPDPPVPEPPPSTAGGQMSP
ncbi:hypothetical protein [Embleya sp. NPDC005971]|uniref:hypothetical protein n=1 Tax=Embleya sp. NPDC005971 TaxID=3156724 RepID=UPI0033FEB85E